MPHLTLEYSANVSACDDWPSLFSSFHHVLSETGKINLQNCKSRAYAADNFMVGTGGSHAGFVHLDVRFLEGRPQEAISEMGTQLLDLLKTWFAKDLMQFDLQITVEIRDIRKSAYSKFPEGTFTRQ